MTVTGKNIFVEMDADGVFVVTLDVPQGPLNPLSDEFVHELDAALDLVASRDDVRGVLVTSGKSAAFAAGWNLKTLLGQLESTPPPMTQTDCPLMTCAAAMLTASSPEAQKRLTCCPATRSS